MSHQPSTIDTIKDSAASAYETVTKKFTAQEPSDPSQDPSNYAKDAHGNPFRKGDFKDQLNAAATGTKPKGEEGGDGLVEKGVSALQEAAFEQGPEHSNSSSGNGSASDNGTPVRPDNDVQVEEFLRAQYKSSKTAKDMPKLGSDKDD